MTVNVLEWVLSASALIIVVMLLRGLLGKRIGAGLRYGLWAVVLVRLLVPVSFFSLPAAVPQIPAWTPSETMQEENIYVLPVDIRPVENSGVHVFEDGSLGDPSSFGYPKLSDDGETVVRYADKISPLELLKWVWIAGTAAMGIMLVVSNLRFSRRLRRVRRPLEGASTPIPVYVASALPSPCLVGLFSPAVYVTEEAAADTTMLRHVLAHELTHYNHRDHLWSVLRGAALAVHWWNPLVWLAVVCSRRDGELACDEGALKKLGDSERTAYGETLLTLVTAKARPVDLLSFATTMTGGKRSLKERIQRIAHQPKQLVSAVIAVAIVLSLSVLVAFGQAKELIDPDSVTRITAFTASSYTKTLRGTIVYTPDDLQKDLREPKDAARVSQEDGAELLHLINTHSRSVYGHGDLTLDGMEHHFVRIDCTDGGFYLVDYWYWNGFSFNPLHMGEDDYTTLITHFDADGNAGTTWQMEYSFDLDYREWREKRRNNTASGAGGNWQNAQITLDESGVPHIIYMSSDGLEEVTGNPIPAPREWADLDSLDSRKEAAALEYNPVVWAELVSPSDGWLVACYEQGVALADTYVYKTEDAGVNWREVTMPGTSWHIADVGFISPDRLIVAQRLFNDAPCFITKDGGATWEEIELPDVQVLEISYSRGFLTMWIGQHEGDPATFSMTSTDLGNHWETLSSEERYAEDHPDDTWSPLEDLLLELTEEDIPMFNGDTTELVRLLRSAERGSRFYTWGSEAAAYIGHGAEEVDYTIWNLPLVNGNTLWLLACEERSSVLMIYETPEEAISAFYTAPELKKLIQGEEEFPPAQTNTALERSESVQNKEESSDSQAEQYYEAGSLPLFQIAFSRLDKEAQGKWLEKIYADGDIAFFSTAVRGLGSNSSLIADLAEKVYSDKNIAFFSTLADYMDEAELELWLERALEDGNWTFQSVLFNKLDRNDEFDDLKEENEKRWAEAQTAEYRAAGVTWEGKSCYYQGQLVNIFLDVRANKSFYTLDMNPAGTVNIKIIRNENNEITGVDYMTDTEVEELLKDMG